MAYTPEPGGETYSSEYLYRELMKISAQFALIAQGQELEYRTAAPAKPRDGMRVLADGTNWNPGSGKGMYVYITNAWVKL